MHAILKQKESLADSLLRQVGETADAHGAQAEFWTEDKRIFVDAPAHKTWASSRNHVLTERVDDIRTLLGQMNQGFVACEQDCPCYTVTQHWQPKKPQRIRYLNIREKNL